MLFHTACNLGALRLTGEGPVGMDPEAMLLMIDPAKVRKNYVEGAKKERGPCGHGPQAKLLDPANSVRLRGLA